MKKDSISIFILILVISTGLGGCNMCSNNTQKYTKEEVKQQMLDYIENKYDMEFKVADIWYQTWGRDWEEMRAYPKGGDPEDTFDVYRYTEDSGEVYYTDFYFVNLMQDEYEEYIDRFIGKYFEEYKFIVGFGLPIKVENNFTKDITFEEFRKYAAINTNVTVQLFVPAEREEDIEEQQKSLYNELSENIRKGSFLVFGYSDEVYKTEIVGKEKDYNTSEYSFRIEKNWFSEKSEFAGT